ncbi:MAG: phage portal protein [Kofleriaceae bacterium]
MGVFENMRENLAKVAAGIGVPPQILAAEQQAGMDTTTALGPGAPLQPAQGYSTVPRSNDYRSGSNIVGRPRSDARVSFDTLRKLADAYDVAQMCITHRIDSMRSYDWRIIPADGIADDMSDAIKLATKIMRKPDHELHFDAWLAKYVRDVLTFDAGALYRIRNRAGGVVGLRVIDGTTLAPLQDAWGNRPGYDFEAGAWAPAYVQFVQGVAWGWHTVRDIIYAPYYPVSNSMYGRSPLESILINANTDIRFQLHFMQRFTQGNIPEGFASSPEGWTPDQLEQWQSKWDALLQGDQAILSQIRWVPFGTKFDWANTDTFNGDFSLFLMRKTAAAFHVTPTDLGFTDDANRATGETQIDVQDRVGDRPLMRHIAALLTDFLQEDLGLPLTFEFDFGDGADDPAALAASDKTYIELGVVSPSDIAELRFGKVDGEQQKVPRFVMTPQGPIPISVIMQMSPPVDANGAPLPGSALPGSTDPLALAAGSRAAIEKSAIPMPAAPAQLAIDPPRRVRAELTDEQRREVGAFRRFEKRAALAKSWRPFEFKTLDAATAHELNATAYANIRKEAGEISVAGLVVLAMDTGRVLMLQRALDPEDPNGGYWEFPGGHIEPDELPVDAALREWSEEVGAPAPTGPICGPGWESPNGRYGGFVMVVADESCCIPHDRSGGLVNPDDPDGDETEAVAWWQPAQLVNNPAVRPELSADLSLVLGAIHDAAKSPAAKELDPAPSAEAVEALAGNDDMQQMLEQPPADGIDSGLFKREGGDASPFVKAAWRDSSAHAPQHRFDVELTDYYAPRVAAGLLALIDGSNLLSVIEQFEAEIAKSADPELVARIRRAIKLGDEQELHDVLDEAVRDAFPTGLQSGIEQLGAHAVTAPAELYGPANVAVDWSKWAPGDPLAVTEVAAGALRANLDALGITIKGITDSVIDMIGNRIGEGLAAGHGSTKIEREIRDLLGGVSGEISSRAERIAHTEVARAQTNASMLVYAMNGVTEYDLIVSDGACEECIDIAANGPYPLGDDTGRVPIHPYCRCADSPRASSIDPALIQTVPADGESEA